MYVGRFLKECMLVGNGKYRTKLRMCTVFILMASASLRSALAAALTALASLRAALAASLTALVLVRSASAAALSRTAWAWSRAA